MNTQEQSEVKYREKRILVAKERMQILITFLKTAFKIDSQTNKWQCWVYPILKIVLNMLILSFHFLNKEKETLILL